MISWVVGVGNFDAQAEQVFANLKRVLRCRRLQPRERHQGHHLPPGHVELSEDRRAGGRYCTPPYPADTIVEVTALYSPEALIEIEAIAVADDAVERT